MALYIIIAPIVGSALLGLGYALGASSPTATKLTTYECGFTPLKGLTRQPFSVAFYLVAAVFLLFDLEITVIYPYASAWNQAGDIASLSGLVIFTLILAAGLAYEILCGVLSSIHNVKQSICTQRIAAHSVAEDA
jgi:NADH:ubiquinone oxidoreductase subunit 3 (subunit A)